MKMNKAVLNDFAVFILTHGRPDNVVTYDTLKKHGYTGRVYLVIDDEDDTEDQYRERYGDKVIQFSKREIEKTFDTGDNFTNKRGVIIYARNACFEIARNLGVKYFCELDDDYTSFTFRFGADNTFSSANVLSLDAIFSAMLDFYISLGDRCKTIAMAQGGDYIGGGAGSYGKAIKLTRKAMNSFICSVDRPFTFVGRINEDVNTYVRRGYEGDLFLTINQICLHQKQTQSNKGGMTETYLESGTYLKSFYSVMYHPAAVHIGLMGNKNKRLHHNIEWNAVAPKIIKERK
jgi:hypothetical protein